MVSLGEGGLEVNLLTRRERNRSEGGREERSQ